VKGGLICAVTLLESRRGTAGLVGGAGGAGGVGGADVVSLVLDPTLCRGGGAVGGGVLTVFLYSSVFVSLVVVTVSILILRNCLLLELDWPNGVHTGLILSLVSSVLLVPSVSLKLGGGGGGGVCPGDHTPSSPLLVLFLLGVVGVVGADDDDDAL
jgi:hypothetical protein